MVRELFQMARSKKACLIFFDEVDAIGGARFDDGAGGDNEVQRTMLEIVNQLDGFDARGNVKVSMLGWPTGSAWCVDRVRPQTITAVYGFHVVVIQSPVLCRNPSVMASPRFLKEHITHPKFEKPPQMPLET